MVSMDFFRKEKNIEWALLRLNDLINWIMLIPENINYYELIHARISKVLKDILLLNGFNMRKLNIAINK